MKCIILFLVNYQALVVVCHRCQQSFLNTTLNITIRLVVASFFFLHFRPKIFKEKDVVVDLRIIIVEFNRRPCLLHPKFCTTQQETNKEILKEGQFIFYFYFFNIGSRTIFTKSNNITLEADSIGQALFFRFLRGFQRFCGKQNWHCGIDRTLSYSAKVFT